MNPFLETRIGVMHLSVHYSICAQSHFFPRVLKAAPESQGCSSWGQLNGKIREGNSSRKLCSWSWQLQRILIVLSILGFPHFQVTLMLVSVAYMVA